jgi:hypothetical protein
MLLRNVCWILANYMEFCHTPWGFGILHKRHDMSRQEKEIQLDKEEDGLMM